jgi:hypothetical protein
VVALEANLAHVFEEGLGEVFGVFSERRGVLHGAGRAAAHLLLVVLPAGGEGGALFVLLEGLFGVDAEQTQRRGQALDANGVAVEHRFTLEELAFRG